MIIALCYSKYSNYCVLSVWLSHFCPLRFKCLHVFNMWNNKYRFLIFLIYIEQKIQAISVIWRCSYAELPPPPRHNGSRVNRQRSVGMLDSVTSRPEFCYSAAGSTQPTSCCASQSSASAGPCLRPHRMGKKTHLFHRAFEPPSRPRTRTRTQTDKWSSVPFLWLLSCQSTSVVLTASEWTLKSWSQVLRVSYFKVNIYKF